jgi:hypothetical protein
MPIHVSVQKARMELAAGIRQGSAQLSLSMILFISRGCPVACSCLTTPMTWL